MWSAIEIASSVDLLWRCANWSGSRVSGSAHARSTRPGNLSGLVNVDPIKRS